jgi:hypothetical protein
LPDAFDKFETIDHRHPQIGHDDVGTIAPSEINACRSIGRNIDHVSHKFQLRSQDEENIV